MTKYSMPRRAQRSNSSAAAIRDLSRTSFSPARFSSTSRARRWGRCPVRGGRGGSLDRQVAQGRRPPLPLIADEHRHRLKAVRAGLDQRIVNAACDAHGAPISIAAL